MSKEGRLKRITRKGKIMQTKQDNLKQRKKIQPASRGRWHKEIPTNKGI